jgi:hypothetical protein
MESPTGSDVKRRGELKSTGYAGSTLTTDRMAIGPCEHVDKALIAVFVEAIQLLYAAVLQRERCHQRTIQNEMPYGRY